jgi:hypothetical protein
VIKTTTAVTLLFLSGAQLFAQTHYYAFGKKVILEPLHQTRTNNDSNITYYQTMTGEKIGVKHEVIIGCKEIEKCSRTLEQYPITSIEKLSNTLYLLKLTKESDPFEVANKLYEEDTIFLSHPNFIKKRKRR